MNKIEQQQINKLMEAVEILRQIDGQIFFEEISTIITKINQIERVFNRETLQARNWYKLFSGVLVYCKNYTLAKEFVEICVKIGIISQKDCDIEFKEWSDVGGFYVSESNMLYRKTLKEDEKKGIHVVMNFKGIDQMFVSPEEQLLDVKKTIEEFKSDKNGNWHSREIVILYSITDELRTRIETALLTH